MLIWSEGIHFLRWHDDVIKWKHFRVVGPLCGEFTGHRWIPLTKASDAELWYFLSSGPNKRSSKQSRRWWFDTLSCSLWRHRNEHQCGPILTRSISHKIIPIDSSQLTNEGGVLVHITVASHWHKHHGVSYHRQLDCLFNRLLYFAHFSNDFTS